MLRTRIIQFLVYALSLPLLTVISARAADEAPITRVMTFNIRYGTAKDGVNHWDKRRDFVVDVVRAFDPDLLGTQETLAFQRDYLMEKLTGYASFGVGRDDGTDRGEMTALFYKKERYEKRDGGHFWLSETPETVGSKGWDTSLPRIASWVALRDLRAPGAREILFLNTHFDHIGKTARIESAKLVRRKLLELGKDRTIVLTGDFNAGEDGDPYKAMFKAAQASAETASNNVAGELPVIDAYRLKHPERVKREGTAHGFDPQRDQGARIDWIGLSRDWSIDAIEIDRTVRGGLAPSDHFPITAVIRRTP